MCQYMLFLSWKIAKKFPALDKKYNLKKFALLLAERFTSGVDSASVLVNASTRLSGGGDYGMGAVVGISTDRLHARGPVGPAELCTYKYVAIGNGNLRK